MLLAWLFRHEQIHSRGLAEDIPAGHRGQEAVLPVLGKAQGIEHSDSMSAECVGENYPCAASEGDETRANSMSLVHARCERATTLPSDKSERRLSCGKVLVYLAPCVILVTVRFPVESKERKSKGVSGTNDPRRGRREETSCVCIARRKGSTARVDGTSLATGGRASAGNAQASSGGTVVS